MILTPLPMKLSKGYIPRLRIFLHMQLTDRQREYIKNRLKNEPEYVGRLNRFKRSKMKKFLSDNFLPLDVTADTFINDFDLLHTYFSAETSWKWHATNRVNCDRKFFKFLKKNFDLDKIRTTNIQKKTINGEIYKLTLNKNKTMVYLLNFAR